MEAILFNYLDKSIKYKRDMPKPQVQGPDDVLIKVSYAGICGTDIHILQVCDFYLHGSFSLVLPHSIVIQFSEERDRIAILI